MWSPLKGHSLAHADRLVGIPASQAEGTALCRSLPVSVWLPPSAHEHQPTGADRHLLQHRHPQASTRHPQAIDTHRQTIDCFSFRQGGHPSQATGDNLASPSVACHSPVTCHRPSVRLAASPSSFSLPLLDTRLD